MIESRLSTETDRHIVSAFDTQFQLKGFIEIIARALVDEPELISVNEVAGMHTSILELKVARTDIGKIIGKKGRTADAIRVLLQALSAKQKKRIMLEIVD